MDGVPLTSDVFTNGKRESAGTMECNCHSVVGLKWYETKRFRTERNF